MKKFIYSFAVIAALGMVACGGNKNEAAATDETPDAPAVVEEPKTCCENDSNKTCCENDSTKTCCEAPEAATETAE